MIPSLVWSGTDLNSISLRGFSCLQDFNVPDEDIYDYFERFTSGQSQSVSKHHTQALSPLVWVLMEVADHNLITIKTGVSNP